MADTLIRETAPPAGAPASPVPQVWDPVTSSYIKVEGSEGAQKVRADDGKIATLGAKADAAVTDPTLSASEIALLKGLLKQLQGTGPVVTPVSLYGRIVETNLVTGLTITPGSTVDNGSDISFSNCVAFSLHLTKTNTTVGSSFCNVQVTYSPIVAALSVACEVALQFLDGTTNLNNFRAITKKTDVLRPTGRIRFKNNDTADLVLNVQISKIS